MASDTNGNVRAIRETRKCEECGRDIDVRGFPMHQQKHERDKAKAAGRTVPVVVMPKGDDVVRAFELGYRLGKRAA